MFGCIDIWVRGGYTPMDCSELELLVRRANKEGHAVAEQIRRLAEAEARLKDLTRAEDDSIIDTLLYGPRIAVSASGGHGK